jgi:hypothetical protein
LDAEGRHLIGRRRKAFDWTPKAVDLDTEAKAFDWTPKAVDLDTEAKAFDWTPKAFDWTPKAFASFSPGLPQPWVPQRKSIER